MYCICSHGCLQHSLLCAASKEADAAGTMVMTIASAVISLGLIYNVVAGGNKAQSGAAAGGLAPANNLQEPSNSTQGLTDAHDMSTGLGFKVLCRPGMILLQLHFVW